ncbi:MAG TPA: HlyD family secretion protein [Thermodesulfovibrionales bacterium]|nr:HlyD family secretion protein [Thermodesulfovibrionales bacterium]
MEEIKQTETGTQPGNHKRKIAAGVFAILAVIVAIAVYFYIQYKDTHISTDDAFVDGHIHIIASKVNGTVKSVLVKSNQFVRQGDVLVELDPADYSVKVAEAQSSLNAERSKLTEVDARIETAKRQIAELDARSNAIGGLLEVQKAGLEQTEKDVKRAEGLYKREAISAERYEKIMTAHKEALARVNAATEGVKFGLLSVDSQQAALKQAEAAKVTQLAEIKRREAQFKEAGLKYGYTKLSAPIDGYVTKKSVEIGNQVQTGQPLMAIVDLVEDVHILANYKETQLEKVRPGQKVEIKVDSYPGKTFKGKVDSIMAGTGAAFSLFPPENATGNYVKVVQRVPVKIVLDKDTDKEHILRIGMSVVPTIIVRE